MTEQTTSTRAKTAADKRAEPLSNLSLYLIEAGALISGATAAWVAPSVKSWVDVKESAGVAGGALLALVLGIVYAVDKWSAELEGRGADLFKVCARYTKLFTPMFTVGAALIVLGRELGGYSEPLPLGAGAVVVLLVLTVSVLIWVRPSSSKHKAQCDEPPRTDTDQVPCAGV